MDLIQKKRTGKEEENTKEKISKAIAYLEHKHVLAANHTAVQLIRPPIV